MPPTVSPRGPLPTRVYWARRLIVLSVPILLVIVLARLLGGSSDASGDAKATQAGARVVESADVPSAGPTVQAGPATGATGKKNKKQEDVPVEPVEPVLAEPTGPCTDSDVVVTPTLTSAPGGSDVPITLNLRTVTTAACTWQVSPQTMTLSITSGSDFIWSTRECPSAIPVQDVVVRAAVDTPLVVIWDEGKRSDETCSGRTEWAQLGFYHVEAAALGGEATDVQFELVAPAAGVITQTAEPEPQGDKGGDKDGGKGGGKDKGKTDESHVPGEDGSGNSEG